MNSAGFGSRNKTRLRFLLRLITLWLAAAWGCSGVAAQGPSDGEDIGSQGRQIAQEIANWRNKFVVFVLDVSGSMTRDNRLQRSSQALAQIVREGCRVGDRVAVFSFDVSPELLLKETTIRKEGDKKIILDRIPTVANNTFGSNIRWAHHEALKLLASSQQPFQVCVLVSDNLHDPPAKEDRFYPEYLKYYVPGTLETPATPESADYTRLRKQFRGRNRLTFGIGVDFSDVGAVRELSPPPKKPAWIWLATVLGALVLGVALYFAGRAYRAAVAAREAAQKPVNVVIRDVTPDSGGKRMLARDTHLVLQATETFTIGGTALGLEQTVSVPGVVMKDPVARVARHGVNFTIEALVGRDVAVVQVDGVDVEYGSGPVPIQLGQTVTVRYRVMAGIEKTAALLFADPQALETTPLESETVFDPEHQAPY